MASKLNFYINQLKYSSRNQIKYSHVSSGSYDPYPAQPLASKLNFNIRQLKYSLRNHLKYSHVSSGSYDPYIPGAAIGTGHVRIVKNYN